MNTLITTIISVGMYAYFVWKLVYCKLTRVSIKFCLNILRWSWKILFHVKDLLQLLDSMQLLVV